MRTSTSSGSLAASAAVAARPALVTAITLIPAAAACTLTIYDNASAASGTVLAELALLANAKSETIAFNLPIEADKGVYASLSGSGAAAIVHFSLL